MKDTYTARMAEIHPDEKGPADNVRIGYKPPIPAVQAVVPVIAHHEVMVGGDRAAHAFLDIVAVLAVRIVRNGHIVLRRVFIEQDTVLDRPQLFSLAPYITGPTGFEKIAVAHVFHPIAVHATSLVLIQHIIPARSEKSR